MFGLGPLEICVIGAIAVMLYGKRLPEVGRSVGQGIGELRRSMQSLSKEMDIAGAIRGESPAPARPTLRRAEDDEQAAGPRFDPPA
jgi:sec-independent protein translocase protein TatA